MSGLSVTPFGTVVNGQRRLAFAAMSPMSSAEARRQLGALLGNLERIVQRDPEQEVQGMAIPVLDAVISTAKEMLKGNPVVDAVADVISVEAFDGADAIRAVDALHVVAALYEAFPRKAPTTA
jgi:hypothetical protein